MRIDFDAGNATELAAVAALVSSLYGQPLRPGATVATEIRGSSDIIPPVTVEPAAESLPPPAPLAPPAAPIASVVAPPVPASPIAPPVQSPGGVEVDAAGLPYDARIHSKPPSKKRDGHWRGKRGLDDATRDAVTAELKAAMGAPAAPASAAPAPMFGESAPGVPLPPEPVADAATAFGAGSAAGASSAPPPPPPAPVAAVAPPPPAPAAPAPVPNGPATDFASLMRKITGLQSSGHMTVESTTQIATSLGIQGVRDLMVRPDLIPSFDALLPVAA